MTMFSADKNQFAIETATRLDLIDVGHLDSEARAELVSSCQAFLAKHERSEQRASRRAARKERANEPR